MNIYLSVDMEGIPGLPDHTFVDPAKLNYERSRRIMTEEANDAVVGVLGFNAYVAGHFGVPVIVVAGDDGACREAEALQTKFC